MAENFPYELFPPDEEALMATNSGIYNADEVREFPTEDIQGRPTTDVYTERSDAPLKPVDGLRPKSDLTSTVTRNERHEAVASITRQDVSATPTKFGIPKPGGDKIFISRTEATNSSSKVYPKLTERVSLGGPRQVDREIDFNSSPVRVVQRTGEPSKPGEALVNSDGKVRTFEGEAATKIARAMVDRIKTPLESSRGAKELAIRRTKRAKQIEHAREVSSEIKRNKLAA